MDKELQLALERQPPFQAFKGRKFWNGLLYGEFATGKTSLAAKFVQKRGLIIAADPNWQVIENYPGLVDKFHILPYDGISQLKAVGQAISEQLVIGDIDYGEIDLVIPDTFSQMQEEYTDWLGENFTYGGKYREVGTPTTLGKQRGFNKNVEVIGLPDYHLTRNALRPAIKALTNAPCNVIFTAHLREPGMMDKAEKSNLKRPSTIESVFKVLAREIQWMGIMQNKKKGRTISFETNMLQTTKSQCVELDGKTFDNPDDIIPIIEKWVGN